MNATNLQPSLLDKRSAIASGIQAQARRWLAGGSKRYLRAREEICKTNFGMLTRQTMLRVRIKIFKSIARKAIHRLVALRAEEVSKISSNAAMKAIDFANKTLKVTKSRYAEFLRVEAGAQWISDYLCERMSKPISTHMRKLLVLKQCDQNHKICTRQCLVFLRINSSAFLKVQHYGLCVANPAWFVRTVEQWAYSSLVVFPAMVT